MHAMDNVGLPEFNTPRNVLYESNEDVKVPTPCSGGCFGGCLDILERKIIQAAAAALFVTGSGGVALGIYGFFAQSYFLGALGAFVTCTNFTGGGCLLGKNPVKRLEGQVKDLRGQVVAQSQLVAQQEATLKTTKALIGKLQLAVNVSAEKLLGLKSDLNQDNTDVEANLKKAEDKLTLIVTVYERYKATTSAIINSINSLAETSPKIKAALSQIPGILKQEENKIDEVGKHLVEEENEDKKIEEDGMQLKLSIDSVKAAIEALGAAVKEHVGYEEELIKQLEALKSENDTMNAKLKEFDTDVNKEAEVAKNLADTAQNLRKYVKLKTDYNLLNSKYKKIKAKLEKTKST